jgi:hypothetical protein
MFGTLPTIGTPYSWLVGLRWAVVVCAAVALAGCTSDAKPSTSTSISDTDAYTAVIRWEVSTEGPPTSEGAALPVVYITAENGKTIDAGVQAAVIKATVDQAKVRFSDVRDDALQTKTDGVPVKDNGVLLVIDPINGKDQAHLSLGISVYRTDTDQQRWMLTMAATSAGVSVNASVQQSAG